MVKAADAIAVARALRGTSYSVLDCVNLIKKVVRTAPGGVPGYTTAGTNDLWNSDANSAKYRDLTWKQVGISDAKPGMLAFMSAGTEDVNHVGLVTEKGTVIHSSKSRGGVVETELTEKGGWDGLGIHRWIEIGGGEKMTGDETKGSRGEGKMFGNAAVRTTSGVLYMRESASTKAKVLARMESGMRVDIIRETGNAGWVFGKLESGEAGYMAGEYLVRDDALSDDLEKEGGNTTTLRRDDGVYVTLAGRWTVAED